MGRPAPALAIGLALIVAVAGCIGAPDDSGPPLDASAEPTTASSDAVTASGYEHVETTATTLNTTITARIQGDVTL